MSDLTFTEREADRDAASFWDACPTGQCPHPAALHEDACLVRDCPCPPMEMERNE